MPRKFRNLLRRKSSRSGFSNYDDNSENMWDKSRPSKRRSSRRGRRRRSSHQSAGSASHQSEFYYQSEATSDSFGGHTFGGTTDDNNNNNKENTTIIRTNRGNLGLGNLGNLSDGSNEDEDEDEDEVDTMDGLQELDRACVRLDGIEVYAIVSALTCATSISCFDNYEPTPLSIIVKERAVFTMISELAYYLSGAVGMMTGLHATLIFSLVTMYGRTALGIDRDDAFNAFFSNTGPARYNGFMSFKISLYCFMSQMSFLIGKKFFYEPLRPLVLAVFAYHSYTTMYMDSESVLKAAAVIYSTPQVVEEEEPAALIDPENRRASLDRAKSMKKSSFSLSTRNFGIDTTTRSK
mmetsp:Transcript_6067/g.14171  ORF Transcript_6067/g.14171 Transcript_6067/m.14171 type:complete len:351 (+) Transcript_6067:409-1461(+)